MKKYLLLLFYSSSILSNSYVVLMGAGGEPKESKTTIFDADLIKFSSYTYEKSKKDTVVDVAFNGGHSFTESVLKNRFGNLPSQDFTVKTYFETIEKYKKLISEGKITSLDSIMLTIDTHGAPFSSFDKSHQFAVGFKNEHAPTNVSADALKSLMDLAASKGVKLAIIDLSCHSGNTLKVANEKTCVITATGPDHYAYKSTDGFSAEFLKNLKPGRNLEQVFLSSRLKSADQGFPMISTTASDYIFKTVYPSISPYLYFKNDDGSGSSSIDEYLFKDFSSQAICQRENSFHSLMNIINQVESNATLSTKIFSYEMKTKLIDLDRMKKRLKEFKAIQDKIIKDYLSYKSQLKSSVDVKYLDGKKKSSTITYTMEQLFSNDFIALKTKESLNPKPNKSLLNLFDALIAKKEELRKEYPHVVTLEQKVKELSTRITNTFSDSYFIAQDEKKLFNSIYRQHRDADKKSNPCRDFKL